MLTKCRDYPFHKPKMDRGMNNPGLWSSEVLPILTPYAIGDLHTNTIENAFSLLKRGVYGTFHKVSIKHLGRYCNEFSYRFNRRGEQLQMFDGTLKNLVRGEVLLYKKLIQK